jgi:hypothetical protein
LTAALPVFPFERETNGKNSPTTPRSLPQRVDSAVRSCDHGSRERERSGGKTRTVFAATGKIGTSLTARIVVRAACRETGMYVYGNCRIDIQVLFY